MNVTAKLDLFNRLNLRLRILLKAIRITVRLLLTRAFRDTVALDRMCRQNFLLDVCIVVSSALFECSLVLFELGAVMSENNVV